MSNTLLSPAPTVTPKIGDILDCSWGYDQTNVDFYQVVGLTPKSVRIRRINSTCKESSGYMSGQSTPAKPITYSANSQLMTKRFSPADKLGYSVNITSYSSAFLWDGKPKYTSWYA